LSIRSKRKWRKNYPGYLKLKDKELKFKLQSSNDFELGIENLNSEIETLNSQLENHPYIVAKKSISTLYPNWENIIQGAHQIYSKATKNLNIKNEGLIKRDPLFNEAAHLIVANQQGSTSLIQRKFSIGYNRAGRIVDQLEVAGIIGPFEGSKARQVLVMDDYHLQQILKHL
jgi:DNA segregation ATPase FtsK/SpoIIIE-like protein